MKSLLILAAAASAPAAAAVTLDSRVMVEKTVTDATGKPHVELVEPKLVVPGDKLLFTLAYKNAGATPAEKFSVANPLPPEVAYQGTSDASAEVSVDGGKAWGKLPTLKVRGSDGALRPAQAGDVTHVRWTLATAIPAGGTGTLSFRGTVK